MKTWRLWMYGIIVGVCTLAAAARGVARAVSPFLGTWSGRWHDLASGQDGTLRFTVRPNGAFTGTLRNDTGSINGSWTGSVSPRGLIHADYQYKSGASTGEGYAKFRAVGTLHRNGAGHLTGRLAFLQRKVQFDAADFDLVPERSAVHSGRGGKTTGRARPGSALPAPAGTPAYSPPTVEIIHDPEAPRLRHGNGETSAGTAGAAAPVATVPVGGYTRSVYNAATHKYEPQGEFRIVGGNEYLTDGKTGRYTLQGANVRFVNGPWAGATGVLYSAGGDANDPFGGRGGMVVTLPGAAGRSPSRVYLSYAGPTS